MPIEKRAVLSTAKVGVLEHPNIVFMVRSMPCPELHCSAHLLNPLVHLCSSNTK